MKNKKKTIGIIICILIVICLIIGILIYNKTKKENEELENQNGDANYEDKQDAPDEEFVVNLENDVKLNISPKLSETKVLDGMEFKNMQLTYNNGQTQLLADVTNTTSQDIPETLITIIFKDKENNEIITLDSIISAVKSGETVQLNANASLNYSNAYDIELKKK